MANALLLKVCTECGIEKPLDAFSFHESGLHNRRSKCKPCMVVKTQEYKSSNQDWELGYRLRRKFGLSTEEYYSMLAKQGCRCAICSEEFDGSARRQPCVDHDHKTGITRGLLCFNCNTMLGKIGDDPARLLVAYRYLVEVRSR